MKHCRKCEQDKDQKEFYQDRSKSDNLRTICKVCDSTSHAARYKPVRSTGIRHTKASIYQDGVLVSRKCAKCMEYYPPSGFYKDPSYCIECSKQYVKDQRFARYGITEQQYRTIEKAQAGKCAVCKTLPPEGKVLCIDHDHSTGNVRGLLCAPCNSALGLLKDDVASLQNAIVYLIESRHNKLRSQIMEVHTDV